LGLGLFKPSWAHHTARNITIVGPKFPLIKALPGTAQFFMASMFACGQNCPFWTFGTSSELKTASVLNLWLLCRKETFRLNSDSRPSGEISISTSAFLKAYPPTRVRLALFSSAGIVMKPLIFALFIVFRVGSLVRYCAEFH
jgi:hypothetical protein